ncbi:uncharacterized protein LOC132283656 isoform X2 [Cornus florida]|uniref:uncharacterized protein LOC132283656 isoform X2 n=1 Tax=Cornus florida TaxID=4283 RepID=UPI0028A1D2F1|nr:uncharacterized protein LOC132283656 isoform X2 [Cornus florida]
MVLSPTAPPFLYLLSSNPPFLMDHQWKPQQPMFSLLFFFTFSLLSLSILIISLYKKLKKPDQQSSSSAIECSLPKITDKTHELKLTQLTHSLLLEISPSKWATLLSGEARDDQVPNGSGLDVERVDSCGEDCGKKKKKKRVKKKRANSKAEEGCEEGFVEKEGLEVKEKQELVCLYPFTSSSSATQRKIKQQYDQLVKSHESNGLTLAQVGQFVNCLIDARNDLQHKSEVIQRKFTITKALLFKADRSSFDRLRQQIYKLELEQKRLEEDAFVYNWLQQQLKLSPAYKKMLEIGACEELKAKSGEMMEEDTDTEFAEISFEELLAQEKKDSFWQRNGKPRSCSG